MGCRTISYGLLGGIERGALGARLTAGEEVDRLNFYNSEKEGRH
jgi:hypothetical protein